MATETHIPVPFNRPVFLPEGIEAVRESLTKGPLAGNGPFTKKCEDFLERLVSAPVRVTTSATHAMEIMALLLDFKPGDEVILPSFTFVSSANPFVLRGVSLRFADNDEHGNILPSEVARLLSKKTKAVMAMNYGGGSADLDELLKLCNSAGIPLLEDAAQSIGAKYKGRPLGTIGALGCFSFHDTKNVTSGEGGALIFRDSKYVARAEILREKGTNRNQFLQGLIDKYTWVDVGSSYVLSEMNTAYLYPQLQKLDVIQAKRGHIIERYRAELNASVAKLDIQIFKTPAYNTSNHHVFALILPSPQLREKYISFMKSQSISTPFHFVSLHTSPLGSSFYKGKPESLPGCEKLSTCLVRLPLYFNMTEEEQACVISKTKQWLNSQ